MSPRSTLGIGYRTENAIDEEFDTLAKSLAGELPRREALRRIGGALMWAALGSLGVARGAHGNPTSDCNHYCHDFPQRVRKDCVDQCKKCRGVISNMCGSVCCEPSNTCCAPDVCVDTASDPKHCGGCGHVCPPEAPFCESGRCLCPAPYTDCGDVCAALPVDPNNCGACGNVCSGQNPHCNNGECGPCPDPFSRFCGGRCISVSGDPNNCGACGNVCPEDAPFCAGVECSPCQIPGYELCDGICTNLIDSKNCGACGVVCPEEAPLCVYDPFTRTIDCTCPYNKVCGGTCTDVKLDPKNCGECSVVCSGATPYCDNGVCRPCPAGTTACSGVCVNLLFDPKNCGACGHRCAHTCENGKCTGNGRGHLPHVGPWPPR